MNNNNNTIRYILVALIVILLSWAVIAKKNNPVSEPEVRDDAAKIENLEPEVEVISYAGVDGKNALELLKENYQTDTTVSDGVGEFVTAIENQAAGENQFWALYLNGKMATVGASELETKNGDIVEWNLESF